jgi:excisionase family DNA binding protein
MEHGTTSGPVLAISVEEAARRLGIARSTAYNYVRTGYLPSVRLGARLLVPTAALERLLTVAPARGWDGDRR